MYQQIPHSMLFFFSKSEVGEQSRSRKGAISRGPGKLVGTIFAVQLELN